MQQDAEGSGPAQDLLASAIWMLLGLILMAQGTDVATACHTDLPWGISNGS